MRVRCMTRNTRMQGDQWGLGRGAKRTRKAPHAGGAHGWQPCGRIEFGLSRGRRWGDQTEQEKLNGGWLCTGRARSPGFWPQLLDPRGG